VTGPAGHATPSHADVRDSAAARARGSSLGVVLDEPLTYAFEDPQAARFLAGVAWGSTASGSTAIRPSRSSGAS